MALTVTARGTGTHNSSATTFTLSPSGSMAAGSLAVLVVAADNAHTNGTAFTTFAVSDDAGNIWTQRVAPLYDPGAASDGVAGAQFTTDMAGATLTSASVITVTFDTATTAKAWALWEVIPASNKVVSYITGGVNTGSATASPTVTTSSITSGDVVIGGLHNEYGTAQTVTADADSTNGSWSAQQTAEIGTTTTGMSVASQAKVTTGTATQTYNPTLGTSSDVILSWIQLREVPFVQVGAVDQTSYVMHDSMTLRFNTFDFALKNPATTPALGDAVTLGLPVWAGTVSSVTTTDASKTYKIVTVTATNTDVAGATAAPYGLSDAPNGTTTFSYSDMSVTVTDNLDATTTTTGVCTIQHAGLWPAMTFLLTNANRGYSAQSFSVTDVTVTWPMKASPSFRIGFGDPIVTMSVWVASKIADVPDGSISGTKIADGSITTPKLAASLVVTEVLVDGEIHFTGGQYLRGVLATNTLQLDANGAALGSIIQIVSTAGQGGGFYAKVAGDTYPRAILRGDAPITGLLLGNGSDSMTVWLSYAGTETLRLWNGTDTRLLLRYGGTAFPSGPATNDLFYRTDLDMWFFYDGTQWLSCTLYEDTIGVDTTLGPAAVTTAGVGRMAVPFTSGTIYLTKFDLTFFVNSGGTALGASHKWVVTLRTDPSATTEATINIDSGASSTYRVLSATPNSVLTDADLTLRYDATKTGTPGTLLSWGRVQYRVIAT